MRIRALVASIAIVVGTLTLGAGQSSAWRDNDTSRVIDPATLVVYLTQLLGLGETLDAFAPDDPAIIGIPDTAVGIDAAPTDTTTAGDPPGTLVVDDDMVQCPNAQYTTITAAVTAAMPGDTIRVCPGIYNETVVVNKTVTLLGSSHSGGEGRCENATLPDPTRDSILHGFAIFGFLLAANGVVLDGFVVEDQLDGPGVYTSPAFSGYLIRNNIVQNNVFGIYFNSSGPNHSVVSKNCVRTNNRTGAANGNGVYSDQGLQNAAIEYNSFTGNMTSAVTLTGAVLPVSNVTVTHNKSLGDDSAVALFSAQNVEVMDNKATNSTGSAIFLGPDNSGLLIARNHLTNGDFNGVRFNAPAFGGPTSVNVEVSHNQIQNMGRSGISVAPDSLTSSVFSMNHSHDNFVDGIRIEADGNSGNVITGNKLRHNAEHDCHDDTVGTGTAGTANTWEKNEGDTENRPGLCRKKP